MNNILDHIAPTPVLDVVDDWPRSTTRTEWFRLTRDLIQSVIAGRGSIFISAGLL